jgi:hypothetical protein
MPTRSFARGRPQTHSMVPASPDTPPGRCSLPPLSRQTQCQVPSLHLPPPPTPVSLTLLWTMRGTRQFRWHTPHSASRQKLLNFILLPSAWPSPGLDCSKLSLRGFDATRCSALCRSAPPHTLSTFFLFFFKSLVQFISDVLVTPLKSFSLFSLNTCPLGTCGGVCKESYIFPRVIH